MEHAIESMSAQKQTSQHHVENLVIATPFEAPATGTAEDWITRRLLRWITA